METIGKFQDHQGGSIVCDYYCKVGFPQPRADSVFSKISKVVCVGWSLHMRLGLALL